MRRSSRAAVAAWLLSASHRPGSHRIDLFFPVPVQGKLAIEMQRLIEQFNQQHAGHPRHAGLYRQLRRHQPEDACGDPGRPSAGAVIMSANFIREYVINNDAIPLDDLIAKDDQTPAQFMAQFWPALKLNATEQGHVYGVPFQNSTPLLYYSVDAFKDAGLDPDKPPVTWQDWVDDLRKLVEARRQYHDALGPDVARHLRLFGWITSALAMSNGGQYYNTGYGGEVYYTEPARSAPCASSMSSCTMAQSDARGRHRRQRGDYGVLPGPRRDDDPVHRLAVVSCATT